MEWRLGRRDVIGRQMLRYTLDKLEDMNHLMMCEKNKNRV